MNEVGVEGVDSPNGTHIETAVCPCALLRWLGELAYLRGAYGRAQLVQSRNLSGNFILHCGPPCLKCLKSFSLSHNT